MPVGLPSHRVWKLTGVPSSTLNYWVRTGLVRPSVRAAEGKRVEQYWSVRDVVIVKAIRNLRHAGASLHQVRKVKRQLADWDLSLSEAALHWDGRDVVITDGEGVATSALLHPGQQVLILVRLPIGLWAEEAAADAEAVPRDLAELRRRRRERTASRRRSDAGTSQEA